jgi:hypothetical protein
MTLLMTPSAERCNSRLSIVGSPGYHGAISGLVKNALDYIEDLREDPRVYLDNTPWGVRQLRLWLAGCGGNAGAVALDRSRVAGAARDAGHPTAHLRPVEWGLAMRFSTMSARLSGTDRPFAVETETAFFVLRCHHGPAYLAGD